MNEIWKAIEGHERYHVSNQGRVKSFVRNKEGKILRLQDSHGYLRVSVDGKLRFVHRLVAGAFCENYREGLEVNHINEIKHDNRAENLEWVTHRENMLSGTCGERAAQKIRNAILMWDQDGNFIREYTCASAAAQDLGVHVDTIYRNISGRTKPKHGYILRKKKDVTYNGQISLLEYRANKDENIKEAA